MRRPEHIIQLKPGEQVTLVVREHFIMQLLPLASAGAVYLALMFFLYYFLQLGTLGLVGWLVAVSLVVGYGARRWWLWYYEVAVMTDRRCIDVQRTGLFTKAVKELPWSSVDDIQFNQRGFLATLLHYGAIVIISTTGDRIELQHVYQPEKVRDILAQYVEKLC